MNTFTHTIKEDTPESSLSITLTLTKEFVETFSKQALQYFKKNTVVDGFRKGTVTDAVILQKIGKGALDQKSSDLAFEHAYFETLPKITQNIIGKPTIIEKKSDKESEYVFEIICDVLPAFEFGEYKKEIIKINKEFAEKNYEVTETELSDSIKEFTRYIAHQIIHDEWHKKNNTENHHGHDHPEMSDIKDEDLPELTNELILKTTGLSSLEELKEKLTESITSEKAKRDSDIQKEKILEILSLKVSARAPSSLVAYELQNILTEFEHDLASQGIKKEEYLAHINKTEKDLLDSWKDNAGKKALNQLIIDNIGKIENVNPTEEEIEHELNQMKAQYGMLANFDENRASSYVTMLLTNQKVIKFLTSLS